VTEEIEEELEEIEKELDQSSTISDDDKSDYTATSNYSGRSKLKVANMTDTLVQSIDEHEESVYSVAWSSYNSWIFGSVSYDGRVLIHHVKQSERLKILDIGQSM
jgi:WD40 repeat protein